MGWTSFSVRELPLNKKGDYDRKAYLDKQCTGETEEYIWELLKSTMVGSTWYGAIKRTNKKTGKSVVFAGITLTSIEKGEFYYKDMSDSMGPYNYDCPTSILDLLSETDNDFALEWREKCRRKVTEKNFRKQFFKIAKDNSKVKYIKFTVPYKEGEEVYLSWGTRLVKGKLKKCWSDGIYRYSQKYINPENCVLIMQDGKEMMMSHIN